MAPKYSQIIKILGKDRVKLNEPLSKHTTFKIGGPADLFYEAKKTNELVRAIRAVRQAGVSFFILGEGSKILEADEGFRGVVIKVKSEKLKVKNFKSKVKIIAEAGMALKTLVKEAANKNLTGLEFTAGIPGTIGGAVRGNAGAWQQNIGDFVNRVKILNEKNKISWLSNKSCQFAYRQSRFKKSGEIILEVELVLEKGDSPEIKKKIADYLAQRQGQPKEPSVGSIFINPKPQAAGDLIEQCGLKGKQIGQAQISPKHANFIVNLGGAKASEVIELIKLIKKRVKDKFGIELKEEVVLLGFDK